VHQALEACRRKGRNGGRRTGVRGCLVAGWRVHQVPPQHNTAHHSAAQHSAPWGSRYANLGGRPFLMRFAAALAAALASAPISEGSEGGSMPPPNSARVRASWKPSEVTPRVLGSSCEATGGSPPRCAGLPATSRVSSRCARFLRKRGGGEGSAQLGGNAKVVRDPSTLPNHRATARQAHLTSCAPVSSASACSWSGAATPAAAASTCAANCRGAAGKGGWLAGGGVRRSAPQQGHPRALQWQTCTHAHAAPRCCRDSVTRDAVAADARGS
jgi:hypothetical protein